MATRKARNCRPKRMASGERGATTMELAIVAILLIILTVAVIDFGLGVRAHNTITFAAREAVRYAAVRSIESRDPATLGKITQLVRDRAVLVDEASLQVDTTWLPDNRRGSSVRVTLTYDYKPFVRALPIEKITLTASAQSIISE